MAEWIWYPGEFEHRLANKVNTRRYFREHIRLPIWKLAPIYPYVKFIKKISLNRPETFIVRADGIIDVETGRNQWVPFYGGAYHLAPGEYELWVSVYVSDGKTATCYVQGEQIESGAGWQCTLQDAEIVGADFRRLYGHRTLSERFLSSVRTDRLRIQRRAEGIYALRFRKRGIRPRGADRRERKGKDKAVFRREPAGSAGFRQLYSHFGAESRTGGKQHGARAGIPLPRAREDCGSGLSGTLCRAGAEPAEQRRRRPLCGSATATGYGMCRCIRFISIRGSFI